MGVAPPEPGLITTVVVGWVGRGCREGCRGDGEGDGEGEKVGGDLNVDGERYRLWLTSEMIGAGTAVAPPVGTTRTLGLLLSSERDREEWLQ